MLTGINIAETRDYKSRYDKDHVNATIFKIGVLDAIVRSFLDDKSTSFEIDTKNPENSPATAVVKSAANRILVVRLGIKEIENFIDPQTKEPVKFNLAPMNIGGKSYQALPERVISLMTDDLLKELADVILNANVLDGEAEKN